MKQREFTLKPFDLNTYLPNLQVKVIILRKNSNLNLKYQLFGDIEKIEIPESVEIPTRQNNLWQTTCFELFLAVANKPTYWEFNFSPSGNWNVYSFKDYREGMQEEKAFTFLPFQLEKKHNYLSLNISINLNNILTEYQKLAVSITNVLEDKNQKISYWALKHTKEKADFHLRDSFINL